MRIIIKLIFEKLFRLKIIQKFNSILMTCFSDLEIIANSMFLSQTDFCKFGYWYINNYYNLFLKTNFVLLCFSFLVILDVYRSSKVNTPLTTAKEYLYQWRLVTFQSGDAVQKIPFIFWNFISIFAFFLQISSKTVSFSLFFKFNIRFFKNIFWDLRPKRILLCVSEGRSQKLNLVT